MDIKRKILGIEQDERNKEEMKDKEWVDREKINFSHLSLH